MFRIVRSFRPFSNNTLPTFIVFLGFGTSFLILSPRPDEPLFFVEIYIIIRKCTITATPHVRPLVGRLVCWFVCHNCLKVTLLFSNRIICYCKHRHMYGLRLKPKIKGGVKPNWSQTRLVVESKQNMNTGCKICAAPLCHFDKLWQTDQPTNRRTWRLHFQ